MWCFVECGQESTLKNEHCSRDLEGDKELDIEDRGGAYRSGEEQTCRHWVEMG